MIKGGYFLKLLKQLFIISLISCFGLLGNSFVNAFELVSCNGVNNTSTQCIKVNNGESIDISGFLYYFNGPVITTYNGIDNLNGLYTISPFYSQRSRVLYSSGNFYNLVVRDDRSIYKMSTGYSCISSDFNNCMWNIYGFGNIYSIRDLSGYYGLDYDYVILPFSNVYSNVANGYGFCFHFVDNNNFVCFPAMFGNQIGESLFDNWLDITSVIFNDIFVGNDFPFGLRRFTETFIPPNNELTGDIVKVYCSNERALNWYENNGYSNRLCYGGLNDFSTSTGVLPIAGQGLEFTDIRFELGSIYEGGFEGTGMSDLEFFSYWRSLYDLYKKGVYSTNPFNNVPTVLFTYFGFVDVYGGAFNNKSILEYCYLKNNLTGDSYNNSYNGVNYRNVCVNPILDYSSGVVNAVGGDWSGILSGGSNTGNTYTDGVSFIQDFFTTLKENYRNFNKGDIGLGYLPSYIILFFCALIVFRFISH